MSKWTAKTEESDLGQITVWDQVDDSDVMDVFDVSDVNDVLRTSFSDNSGVILEVNDVSDANVGLESGRFGVAGRFGRRFLGSGHGHFGHDLVVDLGQLTVWGQGNYDFRRLDACGFGDSFHEQFPQLLLGKGSCFGVSCILFGVLPPDPVLALLDLQELLLSPPLGLEEFFIMPLHGCVELDLELLTGFDQCFNCSLVLPDGLSAG